MQRSHLQSLFAFGLACTLPHVAYAQTPGPVDEDAPGIIFSAEIKDGKATRLATRMAPPPEIDTTVSSKAGQSPRTPDYPKVSGKLDADLRSNSIDNKRLVEVAVT